MTRGKFREELVTKIQQLSGELETARRALLALDAESNLPDETQSPLAGVRIADQPVAPGGVETDIVQPGIVEPILDVAPGIVWVYDAQHHRCVFVNQAVHTVLQYTPAEILQLGDQLASQLMHPDDRPRWESHVKELEALSGNRWLTFEARLRDLHGQWHWFMSRNAVLSRTAEGQMRLVVGTALEITSRKRAEEELRTSEERHRVLAETMLQGVVHQDAHGLIISMNPAAERILGKSRVEFLGSSSVREQKDTIREDGTIFPGDEHPSMVALRTGQTIRGVVMGVWNPRMQMYRWIRIDAVPVIRPEDVRPVEVYAVFHDITEAKQHEQLLSDVHHQLIESYALLDTLSAKAPVGLAFVDKEFRFQRVNETLAAINGLSIHEHLGRTVQEVVPRIWPELAAFYGRALAGEAVVNVEVSSLDQQVGAQRHWLTSYYPVTVDGQTIGVGVVVVEVTAQKRNEQALKDADRHKDEFLATLAHELRNPLAPIRASVEVLKLRALNDADLELSRDVIDRQVTHMARLLEDLLDVSRISRNTLELRLERIHLHDVIQLAVETSRPLIDRGQHRLTLQMPDHPILLDADAVRLAQVFSNLLNNAAKYTEPGGHIEVIVQVEGNDVLVTVRDNGIGIAPEMQPRIFDIFSQASPALQRSQGGLGIGLSLVKGLVELHGAKISAHSEGADKGSDFIVRLPMAILARDEVTPPATRRAESTPRTQCRILVADDMRDNADTLGLMLEVIGNDVKLAYGGEEACSLAESFRPHIALLDIGMPKMSGFEAAQRIRSQPWGSQIMLVALTGWAREEDRSRTKAAGFDHHLVKPVALASIVELIQKASR